MPLSRDVSFVKSSAARLPALLALATSFLAPPDARAADEKAACVRAVERAQVARLDGRLKEARGGFVICARSVCPDAIREDCTRWVGEVDASLPSVVFDAVWADGRDVTGMSVVIDGQPLAGAQLGRAVALDPGAHTFRFEVAGAVPVETRNVIREGEKNRSLHVTFTPSDSPAPAAAPGAASEPAPTATAPVSVSVPTLMWHEIAAEKAQPLSTSRGPIPVSAYVFGGVALLGLGGFAYLGLAGTGQLDSLRSTCVHSCNPSDVTSARNEILAGDIIGFVALAAAGVATVLVLTRPHAVATARAR
jgi:hypothetical protein